MSLFLNFIRITRIKTIA